MRSDSPCSRSGVAVVVAVAGILGGGWVALGVALGVGLGSLLAYHLRSGPEPAEPSVWERRREALGKRRVLVVANETCRGRVLLDEVRYRTAGYDAEVLVIAPALTSHVRHWTSDTDGSRAAAQERLESLAGGARDRRCPGAWRDRRRGSCAGDRGRAPHVRSRRGDRVDASAGPVELARAGHRGACPRIVSPTSRSRTSWSTSSATRRDGRRRRGFLAGALGRRTRRRPGSAPRSGGRRRRACRPCRS